MHNFFAKALSCLPHGMTETRSYLTELSQSLREYSEDERLAIFTEAQAVVKQARLNKPKQLPYWLCSHPTFQIFERFIADGDLCTLFIECVEEIKNRKLRHWKLRKQRKRAYIAVHGALASDRFAEAYARILVESGRYFGFAFVKHGGAQIRLALVPDEKDKEYAYQERKSKDAARTVEAAKRAAVRAMADWNATYGWIVRGGENVYSLLPHSLDQVFDSYEILGWEIAQGHWQPLEQLVGALKSAVKRQWPRFSERGNGFHLVPKTIHTKVSEEALGKVTALRREYEAKEEQLRLLISGLMPVGLKIHCLNVESAEKLSFLKLGAFTAHVPVDGGNSAGCVCYNLPPFGSVATLAWVLEAVEKRADVRILDNPHNYQLQVCSPGELNGPHAAMLGVCFILGSDRLRRLTPEHFNTSGRTGNRPVIYGAGVLNRAYTWWQRGADGFLRVDDVLPEEVQNRTDVLSCLTVKDIENVNLVATLLAHRQFGGYWRDLGNAFATDLEQLFENHLLSGVLEVQWIKTTSHWLAEPEGPAEAFALALTDLVNYAFDDAARIRRALEADDKAETKRGILVEVDALLTTYRRRLLKQAALTEGRRKA